MEGRFSFSIPRIIPRRFTTPPYASSLAPTTLFILALSVFFLGAARYQASLPEVNSDFISWYNDTEIETVLVGVVIQPPDVRDSYINLRVKVERLRVADEITHVEVSGLLLTRVPTDGDWHYGDRVVLRGYLETPPENEEFSYSDYLARSGIYTYMPYGEASLLESGQGNVFFRAIFSLKQHALDLVFRFFPDPEASLMAGILLGVESRIPADVREAFNDTGTAHVIAISGFNITIIAALFLKIFNRWLGGRRGALAAAVGIAIYTILVGADAAVVRAAIMGWLALLARQVGRRQMGLNSLAFTAAIMALQNPHIPWDVGFQLSFSATLGLILYAEPLSDYFTKLASRLLPEGLVERLVGPVGEYFLFTLAAGITTFPIILYHFQRFSLSSIPANILILPAQPAIMILGGLATLLGLVIFPLGQLISYFAWPFTAYTIRVVEWFAALPGGVLISGQIGIVVVILLYVILLGFTFAGSWLKDKLPVIRPALFFSALAALSMLTWQAVFSAPDGMLHLTILDVGTGDAILIQSPTGRYALINGGPSVTKLSDALGRRLPLTHRQLDFLVIVSPSEEQVAALPRNIERFQPAQVLWAGSNHASRSARFLQTELTDAQIPIIPAQQGLVLDLGEGAHLEVLTASNRGAILLLEWRDFRVLLPLGADFADLESLGMGRDIGRVTALLLADNGFAPINPPEWIANLNPRLVLLSVAAGDYSGLPSPETLAALDGYTLLSTDQNGWINLSTDGKQMWVEVERR
ncbi:MAG: DUF4131 domain-containing protein [Chloroflexi bacterium]|nr:DUF4131 domain-containing protein [Chloroflexota bacterium]